VVKITDQNSEIFSGTIDMSQTHNKINRYVSADDLVNPESYKNQTSTDPNPNVASVSSRSEKGATPDQYTVPGLVQAIAQRYGPAVRA
jgi:hypothetical protein